MGGSHQQEPPSGGSSLEATLTAIATSLLGEPLEAFDTCITAALARLVEFLGVERCTFGMVGPDGVLRTTHAVGAPGIAPVQISRPMKAVAPWIFSELAGRRLPVVIARVTDLPPEAIVDAQTLRADNTKSVALFPVVAGDRLLGGFSFGTTLKERQWPHSLIDRMRLIGEIFAGALLRREQESKLRATLSEVETLRERLQLENEYLRERTFSGTGFEDIVGESPALRRILFQAEQVAPTDATVLLYGETGTGKELLARAIHAKSHRGDRTLITLNCAALAPTLIESELFGHEKGAFTGATARKIGRFELADRSTLFLDEVGEIPLALQAKLLRVLQEGEFERLGSSVTHKIDVRVVAASNRDLSSAAREGSFRRDLYYRLGVFPIEIPPLRTRRDDIPLLVWYFLGELGAILRKRIDHVPTSTMERLVAYGWPGNVRELRNVLERAIILSPGSRLILEEFGESPHSATAPSSAEAKGRTLQDVEREHIVRVLESCDWHVRGPGSAAAQLGLNASTLYSRMKKLGIQRALPSPVRAGSRGSH